MNTSERITAMALKLPLHGSIGAFRGGAKVFGPPPVSGRGVVRSLGGRVAYGPLPPIGFDQHTKSNSNVSQNQRGFGNNFLFM